MDADSAMTDAAPSSTAGLFKSKGKKGAAARNAAAATTAGADSTAAASSAASTIAAAPAASSSSSSRRGLNARTASSSKLSFDDAAEGEAEAASTGVDALALQIKLDKQKRLQAKKGARAAAAINEAALHTPIATAAASSSAGLYTPEAMAAMRNNTKSFSAAAASAHKASLPSEDDMSAIEPEANLAQLRRPHAAGTAADLGVGLGSGSFRASGRSKQIALQEADDLRRATKSMAAAAASGSSRNPLAVDDDGAAAMEDVEGAMTRAEELDQLAKDRMVRAAKLQRQRMRAAGQLGAGEIAAGQNNDDLLFIPLSQNALVPRSEDGGRLVQLDREYGVAVIDADDDDHDSKSRLVRDDADDILAQEYDDAAISGDRIAFGDPAARKSRPGVAKAGSSTQIGALLNKSTTRNGSSRNSALLVDDDDDEIDLPRSRRSRNAGADDDDGGMEDDEETRKWEEDLIRKGGGARAAKPAAAAAAKAAAAPGRATTAASQPSLSIAQQIESSTAAVSAASGSALGLIDPADVLRSGLATQLSAMTVSHDKLNSRFHNIEKALLAEQQEQKQIESNIEQANSHYVFYQQLTEQLITTLDCLSEKGRDIRAAWDEMHALKRTRAQEIADAVQEHENDLVDEAGLGVSGAKKLPQVDEFGRDLSSVHESAAERRREARIVWLKQQINSSHPLGWHSFTSLVLQESQVGHARFDAAVDSLLSDSTFIFSDTSPEFRTMDSIKALCEKWKRTHRDTYESAYIPDSMPIILAPYVSLELLQNWNLLRQPHFSEPHAATTPNGESKQGWYQKLFDYGLDASSVPADPSVVDADSHLLPNLIESVLVPIVSSFVSIEFNVLSAKHCKALRECAQEIEAHLVDSTTSSQWKSLQNKILENFSTRIAAHQKAPGLVPTLESTSNAAAASPLLVAKQEALARYRFYCGLHLLSSLTSFQSLLPAAAVKQLASQHLVSSLLPFLAWCTVQTDASLAARGGEAAALAHATKMQAEAAGSSSLLSAASALSPLQHLLTMCTRFLAVFPQQWLAGQAQGAVTTSTSMTKLYDALNTLKQAADKHDQAMVQTTVKQMRTMLHR